MAEQIHFRPEQAKRFRPETQDELEQLEGRIAEINGLLDQVYESGLMRWIKDFVGAMPQVSQIALDGINTPQGQAGMRNLLVVAQQLGKIDPDRLEQAFAAANTGVDKARATAEGRHNSNYNPPGVTGVFKLLHDKELWSALAPVLEGVKAYSAEQKTAGEKSGDDEPRD
ncbi:MAG: hypothetical protein PF501_01525 [Salinisphaera sp.]|jgi:uncharacterized protein YjgD (DUF1641 family)|nr:hypothetical protein [Salinisphaera sp.]